MRAKGLLSIIMTGAMMMGVLSGCGFEPDITWTDTADGSEASYKVTVVVAHDGKLSIDSEQTVKDGDTLNFIATPSKDGDHRITGLMVDGVKRTDYTGELPLEGEVKISLENINQDMTVVVLCDNETGGLGGVDGAVTGLDGSGSNDGSGNNGQTPGVTTPEETVTFTVTVPNQVSNGMITDKPSDSVKYGDSVSITVDPDLGYNPVVSATVTSDDAGVNKNPSLTETKNENGTYTYTLGKVEGNVKFDVSFEFSGVAGVTIDGNSTLTVVAYQAGNDLDLSLVTATITYDNKDTEQVNLGDLNGKGAASFTVDYPGDKITVTYTYKKQSASKEFTGIDTYYLTANEEKQITDNFYEKANGNNQIVNWNVIQPLRAPDRFGIEGNKLNVDGIKYNFIKKIIKLEKGKSAVETEISNFFTGEIEDIKETIWSTEDIYIYIDIDQSAGTCTVWAIWL